MRTIAPSRASSRASGSESWLPETNTNGLPVRTTRRTSAASSGRAAVGQVAGEEHRPARGGALEDRDARATLLCRSEATVSRGRSVERAAGWPGAMTRRARPTSCASSSWSSAPRGALRRLDRLERARDVGAVGVVLRVVDLAARREQHDERDADRRAPSTTAAPAVQRSRGAAPPRTANATSRPSAAPQSDRQRDQRCAGRSRSRRAPRCGPASTSSGSPVGHALDDVAVDGLQVDAQADRQPDRLEARAPVDERHVDVERAPVAGGDRQPDLADRAARGPGGSATSAR